MANKNGLGCTGCSLEFKSSGFIQITTPKSYENIRLLVQGGTPTQDDIDNGKAFSGKTGHWLNNIWLAHTGLKTENVLYDNTIRCIPHLGKDKYPKNSKKTKTKTEAETSCRGYSAWPQVPTHIPLLLLGGEASMAEAQVGGIGEWHGHIFQRPDGRVVGITHPPSTVRANPNFLPLVVKETQNLLDAASNPKLLERPRVSKGFLPELDGQMVADLEWEYDYKTGKSGKITVVGNSYESYHGNSTYDVEQGLETLRRKMESGDRIIGHNFIKADILQLEKHFGHSIEHVLKSFGPDHIIDTQIIGHLLHPHWAELGLYGLEDLMKYYAPTTGWKKEKGDALYYNGRDVAYNYKLWEAMEIDLTLTDQWHLVEYKQKLQRMTSLMQQKGIRIDSEAIREFNKEWTAARGVLKQSLPFNPSSPKQIKDWFLKEKGIKLSGTDIVTLRKLQKARKAIPELEALIEFKDEGKGLKSWYDEEAIEIGRIYSELKVTGTSVGRFSSADPNIQNIPGWAKFAILPDSDDEYLYNSDAKNLEGRTVAFQAKDSKMLTALAGGQDTHTFVAGEISKLLREPVERQTGKTVVHASNYLEGEYNLANRIFGNVKHESINKARKLQQAYFGAFPETKAWQQRVSAELERGNIQLTNPFGEKRIIYDIDAHERAKRGCHYLGCSTGAYVVNTKALQIWEYTGLLPLNIVHDSHLFSLPKGEEGLKLEKMIEEVHNEPVKEFEGIVDLPWEPSRGPNYKDMH